MAVGREHGSFDMLPIQSSMTLEFFFEATGEGNGESATAKTNRDIIIIPISEIDSIQPYTHIRII